MIRVSSSFLACLLLFSGVIGAVGTIALCIGEDHVVLAPPDDHHSIEGCCTHSHGCQEITLQGDSQPAIPVHSATPNNAPAAGLILLPKWERRAMDAVRNKRPPRLRPPPIGLLVAQSTVLRL